jgi:cytochrome oxidase Cu insertion factor (SCO1/SenC/PrrC family)
VTAAIALAMMLALSAVVSRQLPPSMLIDQQGHVVRLDDLRGKTILVSFFSGSATAGSCTAVAGKFLYLQRHLPSHDFRLLQISRDPAHDSPQRLFKYAHDFGADPSVWSFLTGDPRQIAALARALGAAKRQGSELDEPLFVIDGKGRVAGELRTSDWSPEDALALAQSVSRAR